MFKRSACLIFACLALVIATNAFAASGLDGLTLIVVDAPDLAALHQARELVQANGGRVGVMVPPSLLIGWVDPGTANTLLGRGGIRDIRWSESAAAEYDLSDEQSLSAIETFNVIVSGEYDRRAREEIASLAPSDAHTPRLPDSFQPEDPNVADIMDNLRRAGLDEPTLRERGLVPSDAMVSGDKMVGTVAVTFFLVESDGTGADPDSWTWTPEDMQAYMNATVVGLLWWTERASGYRDCWVTFLINHVSAFDPRCQQWVEPVLHPSGFVSTWSSNVMTKMGYPSGNHFSKVNAFNVWQKATYQTNYAYAAFIAYNPGGAPPGFTDGGTAAAWLYGPYFWSLFRIPGWTANVVISHETGHIFGACDEYLGGCNSCVNSCSVYGGPNANCETCNPSSVPCMMRSNEDRLCVYSRTMIGWDHATPCGPPAPAPLPAPALLTVTPGDGLEGEQVNLTVTGSNFVAGVQVDMGPEVFVHTTTLVNSSTLTVWASIFNRTPAGPLDVTVTNRDGQSATLPDAFVVLPTLFHYYSPTGGDVFPYTSPANAGTSLTEVMNAAADGDTVLVPTMSFPSFSLGFDHGVTLQGAWNASFTTRNIATGKTVIDLNGIIDFYPTSDGAGLDGFLIENGDGKEDFVPAFARYAGAVRVFQSNVSIRNCEIRNSTTGPTEQLGFGGAIYAYQSELHVTNCHIHNNTATKGGALYADQCTGSISNSIIENHTVLPTGVGQPQGSGLYYLASSNVTLTGNTIDHNTGGQDGGGILAENSTNVVVEGGVVEYNSVSGGGGGGIAFKTATGAIRRATVRRNSALAAGGISLSGPGPFDVEECRIEWNTGTFGGGLFGGGNLNVRHNLFVGNSATNICGALGVSSNTTGSVVGNTLDRNSVVSGAGGISLTNATVPVYNNIVTNSTGTGIACSGGAATYFDFNNVWNATGGLYSGCAPGAGSISSDPIYADSSAGDYHLAVHSPCIDRGRTGASYNDPDGSRGDMGRYGSHTFVMDQPAWVQNLTVGTSGSDKVLDWDAGPEGDLAQYAVYASTTSGFVPGAANFVAFVTAPTSTYNVGPIAADTYFKVNAIDDDEYAGGYSNEASASPATDVDPPVVYRNRLYQNTPNPFNPETEIRFELETPADVSLRIFDASGQLVRVLEGGRHPTGVHAVRWNGLRDSGEPVASGVYFYRITAGGFDQTRKMVLLK